MIEFIDEIIDENGKTVPNDITDPPTNFVSNLLKNEFHTIYKCVNEELNIYMELSFNCRIGTVLLNKEQMEKIEVKDDSYIIKDMTRNADSNDPWFEFWDPQNGMVVASAVSQGMAGGEIKEYDEDTLERIQSGDFFEDFLDEGEHPLESHAAFLGMLSDMRMNGWMVYDGIVEIVGDVEVKVEF